MNIGLGTLSSTFGISATSRNGGQNLSLLIVVLVALGLSFTTEQFLTAGNGRNLVVQMTPLLLVALGQLVVVLTGGLDVSVGSMIGLAAVIITLPIDPSLALALVVLSAVCIGTINGFSVAVIGIHPIIATLSTSTIFTGIALTLRPTPGGDVPGWLASIIDQTVGGFPIEAFWCILAMIVALLLLRQLRLGLHIYAVGGSVENARLAGLKVVRVTITSYVICSLFAAASGLYLAGRISDGDAIVGLPFTLTSVAAVALGGTQFTGGLGGPWGALLGVILLGILSNGMNLLNISPFLQPIVSGLLLLLAIAFTRRKTIGI